jgi:glycosyltransferase involved in cell wall biosynthesis
VTLSVSVIIPTYNRIRTLPRALDSVIAQTRPVDEIIVVDDGSSDSTDELVHEHYPEVTLLRQPNLGVSAARNLGIEQATGDWIALLDSDDRWLPTRLESQLKLIELHPGHRLCHTEEIWIRECKRVNQMHKHRKSGGHIYSQCLPLCVISPSSVMIHRSLFDDVGLFDENLPACEDYDLWLRICAHEEVLYVDTPLLLKYGGHGDQLSRRYWGMDRFRLQSLQKILRDPGLQRDYRRLARETLVHKARILRQGAEKRGNRRRAAHFLAIEELYGAAGDDLPAVDEAGK